MSFQPVPVLLAGLFAAAVLSGCAGADIRGPIEVPRQALVVDSIPSPGFYSFSHEGGDLEVRLDGKAAEMDLFDSADRRLGGFVLDENTTGSPAFTLEDLGEGEPVLRVLSLDGNVTVTSDGRPVTAFRRLVERVDRIHLLTQSSSGIPSLPGLPVPVFPTQEPTVTPVEVRFARPPAALVLLIAGTADQVRLELHGSGGPVFQTDASSGGFLVPSTSGPDGFFPVFGEFNRGNVRDGHLVGNLTTGNVDGTIALEAMTYSRAREASSVEPAEATAPPAFRYGTVTEPARIQVPDGATRLSFYLDVPEATPEAFNASEEEAPPQAWVALFGPDDERVATLHVVAGEVVDVPVTKAGDYVVAPLMGSVVVGTDKLGDDFEAHVLEVRQVAVPETPAGGGGYEIVNGTVAVEGVPFLVWSDPFHGDFNPFLPQSCMGPQFLRLDQGGDTIAVAGALLAHTDAIAASTLLGAGQIALTHDGFGESGCPRSVFVIRGYVRP